VYIACLINRIQREDSMNIRTLMIVYGAVLLAELGDKTQLATVLFSADREVSKMSVFIAASLALITATAVAVLAGEMISRYISERYLRYAAGAGFIIIGLWTLVRS